MKIMEIITKNNFKMKEIECLNKYKSNEKGEIKAKFIFNKLLTSTFCMFRDCSSLISIDLSSFNTTNVNDMFWMFHECSSLKKKNVKINKSDSKILSQLNEDLK